MNNGPALSNPALSGPGLRGSDLGGPGLRGSVGGGRAGLGHVGRLGLLVAAAVPLVAGCGAPDGVPQWKDAAPAGAAPSVIGSAPAAEEPAAAGAAPGGTAGAAADSAGTAAGAEPGGTAAGDRFVAAVRARLPELALDRRPEEITELGGEACAGLAAGRPRAAVAEALQEYGMAAPEARELVTLANSGLCPT